MKYYAVHRGHKRGVFNNWNECQSSISGYSNAVFKKCDTQSEADYFYENGKLPTKKYIKLDNFFGDGNTVKNNKPPKETIFFTEKKTYQKLDKFCVDVVDSDDEEHVNKINSNVEEVETQLSMNKEPICVYTDGSCINNGKPNAKAGIGVFFSEKDKRNISRTFTGKQSNNTAELLAIMDVSKILRKEIERKERIIIYSDSKYAIRCCTTYGAKLASNGWTEKKPNLELIKQAYNIFKNKYNITFEHILAHTGKKDRHSIGNEGADRLANLAIGLNNCPYSDSKTKINKIKKIYLKVTYDQKEDAKKLGAKWDFRKKKWFINEDSKNKELLMKRYTL